MMASSIEAQFEKLRKNIERQYYSRSLDVLEQQTRTICLMYADIIRRDGNYTAMTGNSATGLAVGLYRSGELLAYSTMLDVGARDPETHVIMKGEKFLKGTPRYDLSVQEKTFSPGRSGADSPYYAHRRAVNFLRRNRPETKGYSFVIVHGAHYIQYSGYVDAVAALRAELVNSGARVTTFKMPNT